jgi:hypothetical protein
MDDDTRTGANHKSRQSRLDAFSERIRMALEGEDADDAIGMLAAVAVCIIATKFDTAASREAAFANLIDSMRAWLARYPLE